MKTLRIFLFTFFLLTPTLLYAVGEEGTIELNPTHPTPFTPITLTLTSYSFNVSSAKITWYSGSKVLLTGIGERKLIIKTGAAGQGTPIRVTASNEAGMSFEASVMLTPQSVDLIYETPESYVPPFYEGRSLPAEGATVKITAMPSISEGGKRLPPGSLSYAWYLNDSVLDELSGAGRQSVNIPLDYVHEYSQVRVLVTTPRGAVAENTVNIYPHKVIPALYTYDDVLGINLSSLITQRFETTKDFTLHLVPYFLSARGNLDSTSIYTWLLDEAPITPLGGLVLSLTPKPDSYGSRTLSIIVENTRRMLQKTQIDTDIVFDTR